MLLDVPSSFDSCQKLSLPILVVEDNLDHQLLIGYILRASIPLVEPMMVSTIEDAWAHFEQCSLEPMLFPLLVLLDINLPQPEVGWQLFEKLHKRYPDLPIVCLSSRDDRETIRHAYKLGALGYIVKPLDLYDWQIQFQVIKIYLSKYLLPPFMN